LSDVLGQYLVGEVNEAEVGVETLEVVEGEPQRGWKWLRKIKAKGSG